MNRTKLALVTLLIGQLGCSPSDAKTNYTNQGVALQSIGTLTLAYESFQVTECKIWGYLGKRGGDWYCRWCIYVDCAEKTKTVIEDGDSYTSHLKPTMEGNTLPINIKHWHDLDGVQINTGPDVDFEYLDPNDLRPVYSLYVHEHNKCSNNVISILGRQGNQFRVRWSGTAYSLGTNYPADEPFALDAAATFTGISLSSEVDNESEIDSKAIAGIFEKVYSLNDFAQQPIDVQRYQEDGQLHISFTAQFTPK